MIKIDFTKTHDVYGTYQDALHLEDNHNFSDEEIETMKQQRFDNWVDHITVMSNMPPPSEPEPSITDSDVIDVIPK